MELNEIYLGDCRDLLKELPDKSVDLIVTDPPYEYESLSGKGILGQREFFKELEENGIDEGFDLGLLNEFVRVLKKINMYVWVSKKQFLKTLNYMVDKYGCKWDLIVWKKSNPVPLCNHQYLHDCEYCLYFHEDGVKVDTKFERAHTVYVLGVNKDGKKKYKHPTVKPDEIIENLIANSCEMGGVVLDPFLGSGTTCACAKRLGRKYLGFEINPKWHAIAKDRLEGFDANGQMNLLDFDG